MIYLVLIGITFVILLILAIIGLVIIGGILYLLGADDEAIGTVCTLGIVIGVFIIISSMSNNINLDAFKADEYNIVQMADEYEANEVVIEDKDIDKEYSVLGHVRIYWFDYWRLETHIPYSAKYNKYRVATNTDAG